ncbi:MAG: (2E,6E)-farnesyl diphosphate synthase [Halomonas meridiana]|jgi:farnesyl diphosphate synthase/geranylgeranyl diphosphate synthase type II|uniref:(2E,6E)-farnesyl diphosphate synthase n=1 Tax=Halomonadaceae TaxID=28256 RepID=UPI002097C749|nr:MULTISPECIES: farnesyl diphosphate synthase [Halomonas]MEC9021178.1 farnesyl diphosphate synthase [Pseudomonadota bacterium]MCO7241760.1 (2E,6E)-farnesyl diphosphate synthase [Halomonas sp. Ps84H-12]MDK2749360.1 (2E,6E)-farnesyl diphosphate synthase [Halomonas meridiana]MED5251390.1 farnesyl diphosphate synthase [Pseudomonadota bacterium]MED5458823.1 farnesyl diphosphate synthase [Pseudomonadota bacterium]|tara:strand:- start:306 stop:1199 length:894 start_codon:yes stop_codon:yes gene_type:complete
MVTAHASRLATLRHASSTRVDATLAALFDARPAVDERLEAAMRHGLLVGGKRLRPLLVYLAGQALGASDDALDAPAAAIELIHAYSLIHDDLPAMDDDDLRRGQPTVHKAFDEATAILAGDALQALAFEVLASRPHPRLGQLVTTLAVASGRDGMVAGQALDLAAVGGHPDAEAMAHMHAHKTGALIVAAVRLGGLVAVEEDDPRLAALIRYARAIGLAFQIHDDILDVTGDTATLGKISGADAARAKPTYPSLLGLEGAQRKANTLIDEAIAALAPLGEQAAPLADLAHYMIERDH